MVFDVAFFCLSFWSPLQNAQWWGFLWDLPDLTWAGAKTLFIYDTIPQNPHETHLCNGVCRVQCAHITAHPEIRACLNLGSPKLLMGTSLGTKAYYTQHTPYYKIKISNSKLTLIHRAGLGRAALGSISCPSLSQFQIRICCFDSQVRSEEKVALQSFLKNKILTPLSQADFQYQFASHFYSIQFIVISIKVACNVIECFLFI
jgi:hypothetical protein